MKNIYTNGNTYFTVNICKNLHKLFKYKSRNIMKNKPEIYDIIKEYENKCIHILKSYTNIIKNLAIHYNKAKNI